jgi:phospholipase/carboxylesterase
MDRNPSYDVVVQRPDRAAQLLLLFHGVGTNAANLQALGEALGPHLQDATIVSVQAPHAAGPGWHWFPVQDVTESNRPVRVAQAMPLFERAVRHWQATEGIDAAHTTLLGFSQGAIMALESTQLAHEPLAARVVALAGRFAQPPRRAPAAMRIHLLNGDADPVMPVQLAVDAAARWQELGGRVTLDRFPGLGHGIDGRMLRRAVDHLNEG